MLRFVCAYITPYDSLATVLFRESAGQVLAEIVEGLKRVGC
jgi:hypothetical protein